MDRGWVERVDYGAEVVNEGFSWADGEEESASEEPHVSIGEEAAEFRVEDDGFFQTVRCRVLERSDGTVGWGGADGNRAVRG